MHLTKDQIDEVLQELAKRSIKDSQFPLADDIKDSDTVVVVRNGSNIQIPLGHILAALKLEVRIVDVLPTASEDTMQYLYLVPSTNPKTENVKDEYITIRNGEEGAYTYTWEQIGSTEIDLSDYYTKSEVDTKLAGKLNTAQDLEIFDGGGAENTYIKITEYDTGEDTATLDYEGVFVNAGSLGTAYHNGSIVIKDYEGEEQYTQQLPRKSGTLAIASDYYTKSQVDTKLAKKLNTAEGLTVTDGGGETDSEVELQEHDGGSKRITLTPEGMAVSDGSALGVTRTDYQLGNIHVQGEEPEDSYDLTLPTKNGTIATTGDVNAKYTKPAGGIPASDMTSGVQTSLGKANTALQPVQDVSLQTGGVHITGESIDYDAIFNVDGLHIYDEYGNTHYKIGKIENDSEQINLPSQAGTLALTSQIPDVSGKVNGTGISTIRSISQADYESLGTYDANTLYVIV